MYVCMCVCVFAYVCVRVGTFLISNFLLLTSMLYGCMCVSVCVYCMYCVDAAHPRSLISVILFGMYVCMYVCACVRACVCVCG